MGIEECSVNELDAYERELTQQVVDQYVETYGRTPAVDAVLEGGLLVNILTALGVEIAEELEMEGDKAEALVGRIAAMAILGQQLEEIECWRKEADLASEIPGLLPEIIAEA